MIRVLTQHLLLHRLSIGGLARFQYADQFHDDFGVFQQIAAHLRLKDLAVEVAYRIGRSLHRGGGGRRIGIAQAVEAQPQGGDSHDADCARHPVGSGHSPLRS